MTPTWQIKLLYDGQCPLCSREIAMLRRRDREGRIAFEDITGDGFDPGRYGLTQSEVEGFMHGVLPDGTVVRGVDVFVHAYRAAGLRWLAAPMTWPILRWVFAGLYRVFARFRPYLSRSRRCDSDRCPPR
ncbi:DUF393 domain-containing protein [Planctomycetales bacterium ZRK34]|nr:DUF393 domain-containing protein [Planctomycetales bacterium ZRK34]